MKKVLILPALLCFTLSFAQSIDAVKTKDTTYSSDGLLKLFNLKMLVKDSITLSEVLKNNFPHQAFEIARKFPVKRTDKINNPIRIAIDPGHIASDRSEAEMEERFVKGKGFFFYESELNMQTAEIVADMLSKKGYIVMITRKRGETARNHNYTYWYKKLRAAELAKDLKEKRITQEFHDEMLTADTKTVFNYYYKNKDFVERIDKINAFKPDLVLVIHYNSSNFTAIEGAHTPLVDYNYSVCFVPGSFTDKELLIDTQMHDFIRLATEDKIWLSTILSSFVANEFVTKLQAPALTPENKFDAWYLKQYSQYTGYPGVFARNLPLTRRIQAPVCYGESLLQNNKDEIHLLRKKDLKYNGRRISQRVYDVGNCYYSGIVKYLSFLGIE